jgi:hypothetical protein
MKNCDACGVELAGGISIGGTILCQPCSEDIREEIDATRAQGKSVNAMGIARRIYREKMGTGNYILRDIPDDLWARAKKRSAEDGISLRELILLAIGEYLNR